MGTHRRWDPIAGAQSMPALEAASIPAPNTYSNPRRVVRKGSLESPL